MGALRTIGIRMAVAPALVTTLTIATPAAASPPTGQALLDRWRPYVEEASRRFNVPTAWIERVMLAESGGRTELDGRAIVSHAGAMGLMQLMPGTWADMRRRLRLGTDPHAPRDNILAGTLYLRLMHDRFGYPGLFGAYNAGPARYAAFLDGRQKLPGETRAYLRKVAGGAADPGRAVPFVRTSPAAEKGVSGGPVDDNVSALFFIRRHLPGEPGPRLRTEAHWAKSAAGKARLKLSAHWRRGPPPEVARFPSWRASALGSLSWRSGG